MTLAIIAVVLTIVIFVIWIAAWRKAKQTGVIDVTWPIDESTEEAPAETAETPTTPTEPVVEAEQEKATTIVEDDPKVVEPPSLVVTENNTVAVSPIENPWANCKTVECEPKPIEELEAKAADEAEKAEEAPKAKKERKPRKTPLERAEAAIAKLEGQIGRRTVLLKQVKKPVTKDERLNKWKASLKELKAARKALLKAAKKEAKKKELYDRFGVPETTATSKKSKKTK